MDWNNISMDIESLALRPINREQKQTRVQKELVLASVQVLLEAY